MPRIQKPDGTFGCSFTRMVTSTALLRLGIEPPENTEIE
ncbi:hypothetical protein CLV67_108105 [Actinoplanes italicus]|uniref:Uncharacterized protein n=1 Tax=Actinoplanes italicus TaxID=113567 RepID=A0A2T0KAX6_9ACTN|nr:hypothetical protein CLV67_108105 [Actinoplanes italicus]